MQQHNKDLIVQKKDLLVNDKNLMVKEKELIIQSLVVEKKISVQD